MVVTEVCGSHRDVLDMAVCDAPSPRRLGGLDLPVHAKEFQKLTYCRELIVGIAVFMVIMLYSYVTLVTLVTLKLSCAHSLKN
jgi:hypothetical protein